MRNQESSILWDKHYTQGALIFVIITLGIFIYTYINQMVAPFWFIITIAVSVWYFVTLTQYSASWKKHGKHKFKKKLFWHSLGYRVVFGVIIMYISQLTWDSPVYVGAVDAVTYHERSILAAQQYAEFNFTRAYQFANVSGFIDDIGPVLYLGFLYTFTGGYYISGILIFALMGAVSVVYIYKTARIIFGEGIARSSGLMYMHFPLALFYGSVTLKEGFVMFFLTMIAYIMTRSINGLKLKAVHIIALIFFLISLFLFRTPVGLGCLVLTATSFLMFKYRGSRAVSIFIGIFAISSFFIGMYYIGNIEYFTDRISSAGEIGQQRIGQLVGTSNIEFIGVSIFDLLAAPVYIVASIITPFPALVEVGSSPYGFDYNYFNSPGRLIWNILCFFSIIGLWYSIKEKLFQSIMIWGFTVGYLYILIVTVTFTRESFAYLGMPFMLILAAVGLYKTNNRLLWYLYLCGLVLVILLWNYLRLATRGIA